MSRYKQTITESYLKVGSHKKEQEVAELQEKIAGLVKKAEKTGIPYGILKKVYDRGMAAWKGGHRPGATQHQWAFARVNSFATKSPGTWGKADKDLADKVRARKESVNEEDGSRMAKSQMFKAMDYSKKIHDMIGDDEELEDWVESKLTKASDYLSSVYHYLEYEKQNPEKEEGDA